MAATALKSATEAHGQTARAVTAFMQGFSIDATPTEAGDLVRSSRSCRPVRRSISAAVPGRPHSDLIAGATRLRAHGFEPVPHLAARSLSSHGALDDLLSRLSALAGVRRVLVIGGDGEQAEGPFNSAIELIESGLLQRHGIVEVGIAGYPEGHPRLPPETLDRALAAKIEAAGQTGLGVTIVTQFAFDPVAILGWVRRLRDLGIEHPVRIGMAGPTDLSTLLRYAQTLRRARLGPGPHPAGRADQASARGQRAGQPSSVRSPRRKPVQARPVGTGCSPFLFVRRSGGDRALGQGRRGGPDRARSRRGLRRRAA